MTAAAYIWTFALGWAAGALWRRRYEAFEWLMGALDALLTDPVPTPPTGGGGPRSHVTLVRGGDEGGASESGWAA